MKANKIVVTLILLVPIGLVAGPVLWAGMRSEIALWFLAAAANAIDLGQGDADRAIESALAFELPQSHTPIILETADLRIPGQSRLDGSVGVALP